MKKLDNIQKLNAVFADLKKGKLERCYLICGEEQYLVRYLSEQIVNAIKKQAKIKDVEILFGNYQSLIENDSGINAILESLSNVGTLFDTGEKIVWIKMSDHLINPKSVDDEAWKDDETLSRKAKKIKEFPGYIANILEKSGLKRNYFVFTAYTIPGRTNKLVSQIHQRGSVVEFQAFRDYESDQVYKYLSDKILISAKKLMNIKTFKMLVGYAGFNLQALVNELEKLIVYTAYRKEITENDIKNLLGVTKEVAIFDLQDSFGEKNTHKFLSNLDLLLQQGINYPQITSALHSRVVMLKQAKELISVERINVSQLFRMHYTKSNEFIRSLKSQHKNEFTSSTKGTLVDKGIKFIEKVLKQSENFTHEELNQITEKLLEADLKTKLGDLAGEAQLQAIFLTESKK